jgi:hypothetical protein
LIEFIFSGFQGRWRGLDIVWKNCKLGNMKATLDIPDDLYKWEAELGTNNQDTHRLYRGEDIDGRNA